VKDISSKGAEQFYFRKRVIRIYALSAAILLSVLLSVAYASGFDTERQVFAQGSPMGNVAFFGALILTGAALILPFALIPRAKPEESIFPEENRFSHYYELDNGFMRVLRICVALMIAIQCVIRAVAAFSGREPLSLPLFAAVVMIVSGFFISLWLVPEVMERLFPGADGKAHLACGCVGLIYPCFSIVERYFDRSISLASKHLMLTQCCMIVIMLAVVYDIRYRTDGARVRARLASASACCVLCTGYGIGQLVMLVSVGRIGFADTAVSVTVLALGIVFGARIFFYDEE
jgi:hypothetical protein